MAAPGPTDRDRARTAWRYFTTARDPGTGLVQTSAGGGFSTTATIGDQVAAAICALRLGVIERPVFDATISQVLVFLRGAPLAGGQLPGRYYGTASGQLVDPPATAQDPGWSGVQLGRLLIWLRALAQMFPQYAHAVSGIVERWQLCAALDGQGHILEGLPGPSGLVTRPDVGSGYAPYAAQGFRCWGLSAADNLPPGSDYSVEVEGIDYPLAAAGAVIPPLHVVPYALLGIEMGWRSPTGTALTPQKTMAERLFTAQVRRHARTGIVTARSDFRRNAAPFSLTGAVAAAGTPWATVGEDGQAYPEFALLSTKAAFAMWALDAPSAKPAIAAASTLFDSDTGWFEGRYEASAGYEWTKSASTNAIVLEALLYRELGNVVPEGLASSWPAGLAPTIGCTTPE
jgi:hypothetical protein